VTEDAQRALVLSVNEAREDGSQRVSQVHLLSALLKEPSPELVEILEAASISPAELYDLIRARSDYDAEVMPNRVAESDLDDRDRGSMMASGDVSVLAEESRMSPDDIAVFRFADVARLQAILEGLGDYLNGEPIQDRKELELSIQVAFQRHSRIRTEMPPERLHRLVLSMVGALGQSIEKQLVKSDSRWMSD